MVTAETYRVPVPSARLDATTYWSIVLAVAQWCRNRHVTHAAMLRLRDLGVSEPEMLARRRATSTDAGLAALLRLAVTIVITHGRLLRSDLLPFEAHFPDASVWLVDACVADALVLVRAIDVTDRDTSGKLDMNVGDY